MSVEFVESMNFNELEVRSFLTDFQKDIEPCYNERTSYYGNVNEDFLHAGQCGVTAVLLANELKSKLNVDCRIMIGLCFKDDVGGDVEHMWLECDGFVIDLTHNQPGVFRNLEDPFILAKKEELESKGMFYKGSEFIGDMMNNQRYIVLAERYRVGQEIKKSK